MRATFRIAFAALLASTATGFRAPAHSTPALRRPPAATARGRTAVRPAKQDIDEIVEKTGVEGGLFSIFTSDADGEEKAVSAKDLLKQ